MNWGQRTKRGGLIDSKLQGVDSNQEALQCNTHQHHSLYDMQPRDVNSAVEDHEQKQKWR